MNRRISQCKILGGFGRCGLGNSFRRNEIDLNRHVGGDTRGFQGFHIGLWQRRSKYERYDYSLFLLMCFKKWEDHLISNKSGVARSQIDFFNIRKSYRKLA
ncbi:hypothetical protein Lal_00028629 [Lupinus albus]|nr:hypothetical protein Lal_00028629 [Lupinus albus]